MSPVQETATAPSKVSASRVTASLAGLSRRVVVFLGIAVAFALLWEGYKLLGEATGGFIPFTDTRLPVAPHDKAMPHIWAILSSLFEPAQRGSSRTLVSLLLEAAVFTFREATVGFLIGSVIGFFLGVTFVLYAPMERGLMPYVIGSQTVPLLAIAPMVVIWGGRLGLPSWMAVSLISAYLTFFPVTINTVRGLRSPESTASELMRSYAASRREFLWKLQVPAALPYVFTALKVAGSAAVVGAIIGELPASLSVGLGRSLLSSSYFFGTAPERLFAAILISALLGITTVAMVALVERWVIPPARRVS